MAILERLESAEGFTELERGIARYILAHPDEVVRMGVVELAQETFTSTASVVRLCRKAGTSGYREFRLELASELERRRSGGEGIDADWPFAGGEGVRSVTSNLAALTKDAIDACYGTLRPLDVERMARAIARAGHVYLFAHGDSEVSCDGFANMALKLGVRCTMGNAHYEGPAAAASARPGDIALFVSYSGSILSEQAGILRQLRGRKCTIALISSAAQPQEVDLGIRIPSSESRTDKIAPFFSQACIRYVLDCLYGALYSLDYEHSRELRKEARRNDTYTRET